MGLKVLVLEAHIDDADCGCGSTIYKHVKSGDEVQWHTFITKGYRVPEGWETDMLTIEHQRAMEALEVKDYFLYDYTVDTLDRTTDLRDLIFKIWHDFGPDMAYIPLRQSRHQDHRAVGDFAHQVSWRTHADVLAYPIFNDFEDFKPNVFSIIDEEALAVKMAAINQYHSQYELRSWFSAGLVRSFMRTYSVFTDGSTAHVEPFEQVKRVIG